MSSGLALGQEGYVARSSDIDIVYIYGALVGLMDRLREGIDRGGKQTGRGGALFFQFGRGKRSLERLEEDQVE